MSSKLTKAELSERLERLEANLRTTLSTLTSLAADALKEKQKHNKSEWCDGLARGEAMAFAGAAAWVAKDLGIANLLSNRDEIQQKRTDYVKYPTCRPAFREMYPLINFDGLDAVLQEVAA